MAKVKVKTHSGAKKRFKVTGSGKVKYQHTNKRHQAEENRTGRRHLRLHKRTDHQEARSLSLRSGCRVCGMQFQIF